MSSSQKKTKSFFIQLLFVFVCVGVCMSAAPGWSIWKNGKWDIEDADKDNIPGYSCFDNISTTFYITPTKVDISKFHFSGK